MALIFQKFPTRDYADQFAAYVRRSFARSASVYESQEASEPADLEAWINTRDTVSEEVRDVFPWKLTPPIVLVERGPDDDQIEASVDVFGGEFIGT